MSTKSDFEKIQELPLSTFEAIEIVECNFDPHPYMITPEHIAECDMFLDEYAIMCAESRGVKCGQKVKGRRCNLPYNMHKHDNALLLKPLYGRDVIAEAKKNNNTFPDDVFDDLRKIKDFVQENSIKIDGFLFRAP